MRLSTEVKRKYLAKAVELGISNPQFSVRHSNQGLETEIELKADNNFVARCHLSHFPGCCGIAVLHNYHSDWQYHDTIPKLLFQLREEMALAGNKGLLIYTDVDGDAPDFLRELGYRTATRNFLNPNSGHRVTTWTKRIGQNREDY